MRLYISQFRKRKEFFNEQLVVSFAYRMAVKSATFPNAHRMADINGFNATVPLAIAGASMKILAKIYRAPALKVLVRIVLLVIIAQLRDAVIKTKEIFLRILRNT